ncbi:LPXTG cell wall anchor domain-containing protein [Clostridium sp.]|uniref:LPXTG cell wall anchor domain-containing protein n=1 Tax=Clostridium sp. TaxID=1506 RepID=UPI001D663A72|nr:LPXTG cell wall anchor domain-containing protein [Clostridium sp.]MBS5936950.1 LPXTG cell wall anchor domain-containing protein [Clostridium sp.]
MEELLIDSASREEIFAENRKLEIAIKVFKDYTEEVKPEEKPEVKPEEKPENGNGGYSNSGEESDNKKPGKLPQTGDPSALAKMFLGISSLAGGAFVYKKKKDNSNPRYCR